VRLFRHVALAIALTSTVPVFVYSQNNPNQVNRSEDTSTRSVRGTVTDSSGKPVEGAIVQCKDMKTLQVRSFVTKSDGKYHFYGLSPNADYQFQASHNGSTSKAKRLSVFDTHKDTTIDLKLK
jgi:protocatechuate 3,4-dioxygenase beta subunit